MGTKLELGFIKDIVKMSIRTYHVICSIYVFQADLLSAHTH